MRRVIYDTGIYIDYLRRGDRAQTVETSTALGIVHLSAVVAAELLVGAPDQSALRFLERLVDRFDAVGRLAVPLRVDWLRAGHAIRHVGQRYGYDVVGRARLTKDALIMATALRIGAAVVTRNVNDFVLLHEYLTVPVVDLQH